jgi:hypothetical protein
MAFVLRTGGEVVIVIEAVRFDDLVAHARVLEGGKEDGRFHAGGATALIEDMRDGFGAEGAAVVSVADRTVEGDRAVDIEEAKEA